jgi:hypothetical protein
MTISNDLICSLNQDYLFRDLYKNSDNPKKKFLKKNSMIMVMSEIPKEEFPRVDKMMFDLAQDKEIYMKFSDVDPKACKEGNIDREVFSGPRNSYVRVRSKERAFDSQIFDFNDEREIFTAIFEFYKKGPNAVLPPPPNQKKKKKVKDEKKQAS